MSVIRISPDYSTSVVIDKLEFEDICISALRYALYRHTYILDFTLDFIENYSDEVMSNRVWNVILHDVNERLRNWHDSGNTLQTFDDERIKIFKDWLVDYGKEYGYCNREYECK